jgi:hypothetical protein
MRGPRRAQAARRSRLCSACRWTAAAPSAIKTSGVPVDQMSFLEDRRGPLERAACAKPVTGEGMWGAERQHGPHGAAAPAPCRLWAMDAILQLNRPGTARLPGPNRGSAVQNRHVGDWLIWGGDDGAWAVRSPLRVLPPSCWCLATPWSASKPWVNTRCWSARPAVNCASAPCACSAAVRCWPAATRWPMHGRARRARMASSTAPSAVMKDCSGCLSCPMKEHAGRRRARPRDARGLSAPPRSGLCRIGRTGQQRLPRRQGEGIGEEFFRWQAAEGGEVALAPLRRPPARRRHRPGGRTGRGSPRSRRGARSRCGRSSRPRVSRR